MKAYKPWAYTTFQGDGVINGGVYRGRVLKLSTIKKKIFK